VHQAGAGGHVAQSDARAQAGDRHPEGIAVRTTDVRSWLETLEEQSAPEPDAAFVARLEARLRTMDQVPDIEPSAPRRRRAGWVVAAAPVAALTAAAAAAMTLLPSEPKPKSLTTADPGVTAPSLLPEATPSSEPTPTTAPPAVAIAPTVAPSPAGAPTPTTVQRRPVAIGPASGPGGDSPATTAVTAPRATDTTVAKPEPTTTVPPAPPAPQSMSLQCTTGVTGGSGVVRCEWSQSTSAQFRWYRLWRESEGAPPAVVFQSDNRTAITYYDTQVQLGARYYYKVDVIDGSGNVIAQSSVVPASCC
jgi:hypothetical protein